MSTLIYIAPAFGEDHHPQCRIYMHMGAWPKMITSVADHYRRYPEQWREVGLMNYQGKLVCFEGNPKHMAELVNSQPLMAGAFFTFED